MNQSQQSWLVRGQLVRVVPSPCHQGKLNCHRAIVQWQFNRITNMYGGMAECTASPDVHVRDYGFRG